MQATSEAPVSMFCSTPKHSSTRSASTGALVATVCVAASCPGTSIDRARCHPVEQRASPPGARMEIGSSASSVDGSTMQ